MAFTRALILILFFLFGASFACAEKRVALVIGNSNYSLAPLTNPVNDADDLTATLQRLGFDVTERKDVTVSDFDRTLDEFIPKAQNADVAFFFFAGHGVQIDKRGYLAPVDIKVESESSALRELVAIQEVISRIENAAKVSVIVLDACRNSPLHERLRRIARDQARGTESAGLPPVSVVGSNTLIVYATVPGETAKDGMGRNSPFTASLLKNMETPGLEIELMFKRVTADVLSTTGGKQQPERLSRLQDELILLAQPTNPKTAIEKPNTTPSPPLSEVAQTWDRIKDAKNPAVFKAFREQFGKKNPVYDTIAADREAELKQERTAIAAPPKPIPAIPAEDTCDGLLVSVSQGKPPCIKPGSGESFKDCAECPEMVMVPAGSFMMGSPESEPERHPSEGPQRRVTIAKPFAVGKFAVTFAEWDACVADRGCGGYKPSDQGWGRGDRPAINISWEDAKTYVAWLSKTTGQAYRLLSEAEREYVARAGTTTPFWWGASITPEQANYDCNREPYEGGGRKGENRNKTMPVKSFMPNPWGFYQVNGNVWEWVEDCWHSSTQGVPEDGSASTSGDCDKRVLRGGHWNSAPRQLRSAYRSNFFRGPRLEENGFRVARTLTP